jgi:hypothetical protein
MNVSSFPPSSSHLPPEDLLDGSYGLETLFDTHNSPSSERSSSLFLDNPYELDDIHWG